MAKDFTHIFPAELMGKHDDRFGQINVTPPHLLLEVVNLDDAMAYAPSQSMPV